MHQIGQLPIGLQNRLLFLTAADNGNAYSFDASFRNSYQCRQYYSETLKEFRNYFNNPSVSNLNDILNVLIHTYFNANTNPLINDLIALESRNDCASYHNFRRKEYYESVGLKGTESHDEVVAAMEKYRQETQTYKGAEQAQERSKKLDYFQKLLKPDISDALEKEANYKKEFLACLKHHHALGKLYNKSIPVEVAPSVVAQNDEPKNKTVSITLADKTHTLEPNQHIALLKCNLYKNLYNECNGVDFSQAAIPTTIDDVTWLADLIENPDLIKFNTPDNPGKLFELADYVDAPQKTSLLLGELFLHEAKNQNTTQSADITRLARAHQLDKLKEKVGKLLYYPTFNDFVVDYAAKTGKELVPSSFNNDFSYGTLSTKGLLKKLTKLNTIAGFFTMDSGTEETKRPTIDLSGHAITDFCLKDFHYSGSPMIYIDLSNNRINGLSLGQIHSPRHKGSRCTLILDDNPITQLCDFNTEFFRKGEIRFYISLRNIRFSAEQLKLLPPMQTARQKAKNTKDNARVVVETDYGTHVLE